MIITCEFPSLHVNSLFILTFFSLNLSTIFMMKILTWDQIDFIWESSWLTNITSFGQSSWNHEEGQQQGSFKTSTGFIGQDFNWPGWSFKILDWFFVSISQTDWNLGHFRWIGNWWNKPWWPQYMVSLLLGHVSK